MKPENAAYLCALKSELDGIVITSVSNPDSVISFGNEDKMLIDIITKVSSPLVIPRLYTCPIVILNIFLASLLSKIAMLLFVEWTVWAA